MRDFITKNFFSLVVIVLLLVLFVQRCGDDGRSTPIDTGTTVKIDTIWVVKDSVVFAQPQILYGRRDTVYENTKEFIPSADYSELVKQFTDLKQELLTKQTYADTLRIDSMGYVAVRDEIQRNRILERKYSYDLKYPAITKTVTTYIPDDKQVYIGGGIGGNKDNLVNSANLGLLYKDKKDRVFGVGATKTFSPNLPVTYGLSTYWKIKVKH